MLLFKGEEIQIGKTTVVELLQNAEISGKLWTAKCSFKKNRRVEKVIFLKYVTCENREIIAGMKKEGEFKMYHPNIATVYGAQMGKVVSGLHTHADVFCVLMEYIEGENLLNYRNAITTHNKEYDETEMLSQMMQLLYGVQYYTKMHEKDPLVHRDLKPENLMIRKDNKQLVIVDFDWVHNHNSISTIKKAEENKGAWAVCGSPGYSDPRLFRDYRTDVKMDIYSLGRIFCFFLRGKHYFEPDEIEVYSLWAQNDNSELYALKDDRFPEKYREEKYKFLIDTIRKMVAPVDERYPDVDCVIENMKKFLENYCGTDVEKMHKIAGHDNILSSKDFLEKYGDTADKEINVTVKINESYSRNHTIRNNQALDLKKDYNAGICLHNIGGKMYYMVYEKETMKLCGKQYNGKKHIDEWSNGTDRIKIRY